MLNSLGQCLSLVASFIFPTSQAPQYTPGCITNIAIQALGFVLTMGMWAYYK